MIGWAVASFFFIAFSIMFRRLGNTLTVPQEQRMASLLCWLFLAVAVVCVFIGTGKPT